MDRKYEYREGVLWHREGNYPIPADEPQCILRAKDPDTIAALRAYIAQSDSVYAETGDENAKTHADDARRCLDDFLRFQRDNPQRVKRGCHNCG